MRSIYIAFAFVFVTGQIASAKYIEQFQTKSDQIVISVWSGNKTLLKLFTLGFEQIVALGLWFDTLQAYGDIAANRILTGIDDRLNIITTLDPKWREVHKYGGWILDELGKSEAAVNILALGTEHIPSDPEIPYYLALLYWFSFNDIDNTIKYLRMAVDRGHWLPHLPALIGRLQIEQGREELAVATIAEVYQEQTQEHLIYYWSRKLRKAIESYHLGSINRAFAKARDEIENVEEEMTVEKLLKLGYLQHNLVHPLNGKYYLQDGKFVSSVNVHGYRLGEFDEIVVPAVGPMEIEENRKLPPLHLYGFDNPLD